jgi:hypothetical protein
VFPGFPAAVVGRESISANAAQKGSGTNFPEYFQHFERGESRRDCDTGYAKYFQIPSLMQWSPDLPRAVVGIIEKNDHVWDLG